MMVLKQKFTIMNILENNKWDNTWPSIR